VAGAISKKGGKIIQEESDKIGFVPVGGAVMTSAGNLPCKVVIHAVGPRYGEGDEDSKLALAVNSALSLASQNGFASVCMPAISSGIFGFPKDKCAKISLDKSKQFLQENSTINTIEFCLFDEETLRCFERELGFLKDEI
jgi:O-acetyl-ADP-ribose deacetylase (regulator of RNase III)